MKILVVGDPHGKLPSDLLGIVNKNKIEVIVVPGEIPCVPFTVFGPKNYKGDSLAYTKKNYKDMLDQLSSFKLPTLILRGNSYTNTNGWNKFSSKLFKKYPDVFYKRTGKVKLKGQTFVLFDMIWEPWSYRTKITISKNFFHRDTSYSKSRIAKFNDLMKENKDCILISHAPPYGYLDKVPKKGSVGSKEVLKIVNKYKPKLVLCGHIHEGKGRAKIGNTLVINAGARGQYDIIDIK